MYWREIGKIGVDQNIFIDLTLADKFINIQNEVTSDLIDYSSNGIGQLVYYRVTGDIFDAFVRVYSHMNRENSKVFKEYYIGRVASCSFLSVKFSISRIVAV